MKCEICGADPETLVLLPKTHPDGKLNTIACEDCSISSGMYCEKHQRPHIGFEDETTACIPCIEEAVQTDGEKIAGNLAVAITNSEKAPEIQRAINSWLETLNRMIPNIDLAELPLAMRVLRTPHALNIARAVVTYAQRTKTSTEEVIEKVAEEGAGVILPWEFTEEN